VLLSSVYLYGKLYSDFNLHYNSNLRDKLVGSYIAVLDIALEENNDRMLDALIETDKYHNWIHRCPILQRRLYNRQQHTN